MKVFTYCELCHLDIRTGEFDYNVISLSHKGKISTFISNIFGRNTRNVCICEACIYLISEYISTL